MWRVDHIPGLLRSIELPRVAAPCWSTATGCCLPWLAQKLKILAVEPGKDDDEGYVTFQVRAATGLAPQGGNLWCSARIVCLHWAAIGCAERQLKANSSFQEHACTDITCVAAFFTSEHPLVDGLVPLPACTQAWFKNVHQMGQRAQGWHTQTFVERSRFLRHNGRWLYGESHARLPTCPIFKRGCRGRSTRIQPCCRMNMRLPDVNYHRLSNTAPCRSVPLQLMASRTGSGSRLAACSTRIHPSQAPCAR